MTLENWLSEIIKSRGINLRDLLDEKEAGAIAGDGR